MKKTGIVFAASIMAIGMVLSGCSAPAGEETTTETTEEVTTTTTTEETTASETEESETETEESEADENEGKVLKTKTVYSFVTGPDDCVITSRKEYNEKGLVVSTYSSTEEDPETFSITTYTYEYDEHGNAVKSVKTSPDLTESVILYEYDDKGRVIKETTIDADNNESVYEWEYVGEGEHNEGIYYTLGSESSSKTREEYNEYGKLEKLSFFDKDGNVTYWVEFEFDEIGNAVGSRTYHADGSLFGGYVFEYDEQNRIVQYSNYNCNEKVSAWHALEYDDDNHTVLDTYHGGDNDFTYETLYEYDEEGYILARNVMLDRGDYVDGCREEYEYY